MKTKFLLTLIGLFFFLTPLLAQTPPANTTEVLLPCGGSFWVANTDEAGTQTNQTTGTDKLNGQNNSGGNAILTCTNKGMGWYLPTQKELSRIYYYYKIGRLSGFSLSLYWSSLFDSSGNAWFVDFSGGDVSNYPMGNGYRVRCAWRP